MRSSFSGHIVCEPRHATWFSSAADALLVRHEVARAAADPAPIQGAERPGGWEGIIYFRLHGTPRKYWSRYDDAYLAALGDRLRAFASRAERWVVFDNTAGGAALENAWELHRLLLPDSR